VVHPMFSTAYVQSMRYELMCIVQFVVCDAGLAVNGLRILDLAAATDRRVDITGDVELDIASRRTDDDDDDDDEG